jgi:hypothetical protein
MLKRNRAEEGGEEERIFHTFIQNQGEVRKSTRNMVIESEGTFDLAETYVQQPGNLTSV